MNYKIIDKEKYYRKGVFRHFTEDCKCSTSITARIDVTELKEFSKKTETKFYINFLYVLSKVLNSREDYRMGYLWETKELICYNKINPTQYIFHDDTETCSPVYTTYYEDYKTFYYQASKDIEKAKSHFEMIEHIFNAEIEHLEGAKLYEIKRDNIYLLHMYYYLYLNYFLWFHLQLSLNLYIHHHLYQI